MPSLELKSQSIKMLMCCYSNQKKKKKKDRAYTHTHVTKVDWIISTTETSQAKPKKSKTAFACHIDVGYNQNPRNNRK